MTAMLKDLISASKELREIYSQHGNLPIYIDSGTVDFYETDSDSVIFDNLDAVEFTVVSNLKSISVFRTLKYCKCSHCVERVTVSEPFLSMRIL